LETPDLQHLLTELHPQPMNLEFLPFVIEQKLRRHRLAMPWRGGLSHQEDVRFVWHGKEEVEGLKTRKKRL
jgi:hypothetical protein